MMKRFLWLGIAILIWLLAYAWHGAAMSRFGIPFLQLQLSYGLTYAAFAVLLIGALARLPATEYPAFWRMSTVLLGAVLAAIDIQLHGFAKGAFFPLWAAALIGLSVISLATRFLPRRLLILWFGREVKA